MTKTQCDGSDAPYYTTQTDAEWQANLVDPQYQVWKGRNRNGKKYGGPKRATYTMEKWGKPYARNLKEGWFSRNRLGGSQAICDLEAQLREAMGCKSRAQMRAEAAEARKKAEEQEKWNKRIEEAKGLPPHLPGGGNMPHQPILGGTYGPGGGGWAPNNNRRVPFSRPSAW